jgi:predicted ATP-binding protein involved in virulence
MIQSPGDEEIIYVGAWFDDLGPEEFYHRDRWEPFVRCVLFWVGQEKDWRRHPRRLFGGTSFRHGMWSARFRRPHVEGIFVEVPRSLAARVDMGLQTSLSVRGLLQVETLNVQEFRTHFLAESAWLIGDILVPLDGSTEGSGGHEDSGFRVAYPREDEVGVLTLTSLLDAEEMLSTIVARGVHEPSGFTVARSGNPVLIEPVVIRTMHDMWHAQQAIPAYLALFDLEQTPFDFENRLVDVVSRQLVKKAYKTEVILWSWTGTAVHHPRTYYAALTMAGHRDLGRGPALFKGVEPEAFEYGDDRLSGDARPLLRWRHVEGLTRFGTAPLPPDTTVTAGKYAALLRHRVAHVVRAAGEAQELRVETLELHHIRNHEAFSHRFAPRFNVIIGDNARGKTTLLDALAAVLFGVVSPKDRGERLREDDVMERHVVHDDTVSVELQYPAKITALIHLRGRTAARATLTRDEQGASRLGDISGWMERLTEQVRKGVPVDLPLVVYYGVARAHQPTTHQSLEVTSPTSRLTGYAGALDGRLDPLPFQRWFKTMELAALQERRSIVLLEVVREAVRRCIEGCETLQHVVARDEIMMRLRDGRLVPFRQLSDGYRLTLAMVADIAWRCVTLNPHLGPAATQETSGVVLVDELDLHLHPRWQRHIVEDLRRAFPRLQFIASTHSPFIVQSMKGEEVLSLDQEVKMDYQAASIEDITEEAMGVEGVQRSQRFLEMERAAEAYYRLLETKPVNEEAAERLKAQLDELMLPFGDNPAYVAFVRSRRAAKGPLAASQVGKLQRRTPAPGGAPR